MRIIEGIKRIVAVFPSLFATILLINVCLYAQTITVEIPASRDNTLYEDASGSLSNGLGEGFYVGRTNQTSGTIRRGLIYFPVSDSIPSSLPPGPQIQSVSLYLHISNSTAATPTISMHRVTSDWGEGSSVAPGAGGSGTAATAGDATWIHTIFDTDLWSQAGGDFASSPSEQFTVSDTGDYVISGSVDMVADVQAWVNQGIDNFGWILIGDESVNQTAKRFDSKDNTNEALRPVLTVEYTIPTAIRDDDAAIPASIELQQNYPNPFNPATEIKFGLAKQETVKLAVYDVLGKQVAVLAEGSFAPGSYRAEWDAGNFASGVYFYRLESAETVLTRKMILMQ